MKAAALLVLTLAATAAGLFGGRLVLLGVVIVAAAAATGELLRLVRARGVVPAAPAALAGTAALLLMAHVERERGPRFFPAVVAGVLMLAFIEVLLRRSRDDVTRTLAYTVVPVLAVGVLASFIVAIRGMPEGFRLVLVLVTMVLATEVVPTAVGAVGGRRLAVTPWKRMAGAQIGSLTVAAITAATLPETFSWTTALSLGLFIGFAAPVGRMAAAMIERDLREHATGARVAPAAVLVRIDGLLLAAPVFFYVFRALTR